MAGRVSSSQPIKHGLRFQFGRSLVGTRREQQRACGGGTVVDNGVVPGTAQLDTGGSAQEVDPIGDRPQFRDRCVAVVYRLAETSRGSAELGDEDSVGGSVGPRPAHCVRPRLAW